MRVKWNRQLDGSLTRPPCEEGAPPLPPPPPKEKSSPKFFRLFRRKKRAPPEVDDEDCASVTSVASQPVAEVCPRDRTLSIFSSFRIRKKPKHHPLQDEGRYSSPDLRKERVVPPVGVRFVEIGGRQSLTEFRSQGPGSLDVVKADHKEFNSLAELRSRDPGSFDVIKDDDQEFKSLAELRKKDPGSSLDVVKIDHQEFKSLAELRSTDPGSLDVVKGDHQEFKSLSELRGDRPSSHLGRPRSGKLTKSVSFSDCQENGDVRARTKSEHTGCLKKTSKYEPLRATNEEAVRKNDSIPENHPSGFKTPLAAPNGSLPRNDPSGRAYAMCEAPAYPRLFQREKSNAKDTHVDAISNGLDGTPIPWRTTERECCVVESAVIKVLEDTMLSAATTIPIKSDDRDASLKKSAVTRLLEDTMSTAFDSHTPSSSSADVISEWNVPLIATTHSRATDPHRVIDIRRSDWVDDPRTTCSAESDGVGESRTDVTLPVTCEGLSGKVVTNSNRFDDCPPVADFGKVPNSIQPQRADFGCSVSNGGEEGRGGAIWNAPLVQNVREDDSTMLMSDRGVMRGKEEPVTVRDPSCRRSPGLSEDGRALGSLPVDRRSDSTTLHHGEDDVNNAGSDLRHEGFWPVMRYSVSSTPGGDNMGVSDDFERKPGICVLPGDSVEGATLKTCTTPSARGVQDVPRTRNCPSLPLGDVDGDDALKCASLKPVGDVNADGVKLTPVDRVDDALPSTSSFDECSRSGGAEEGKFESVARSDSMMSARSVSLHIQDSLDDGDPPRREDDPPGVDDDPARETPDRPDSGICTESPFPLHLDIVEARDGDYPREDPPSAPLLYKRGCGEGEVEKHSDSGIESCCFDLVCTPVSDDSCPAGGFLDGTTSDSETVGSVDTSECSSPLRQNLYDDGDSADITSSMKHSDTSDSVFSYSNALDSCDFASKSSNDASVSCHVGSISSNDVSDSCHVGSKSSNNVSDSCYGGSISSNYASDSSHVGSRSNNLASDSCVVALIVNEDLPVADYAVDGSKPETDSSDVNGSGYRSENEQPTTIEEESLCTEAAGKESYIEVVNVDNYRPLTNGYSDGNIVESLLLTGEVTEELIRSTQSVVIGGASREEERVPFFGDVENCQVSTNEELISSTLSAVIGGDFTQVPTRSTGVVKEVSADEAPKNTIDSLPDVVTRDDVEKEHPLSNETPCYEGVRSKMEVFESISPNVSMVVNTPDVTATSKPNRRRSFGKTSMIPGLKKRPAPPNEKRSRKVEETRKTKKHETKPVDEDGRKSETKRGLDGKEGCSEPIVNDESQERLVESTKSESEQPTHPKVRESPERELEARVERSSCDSKLHSNTCNEGGLDALPILRPNSHLPLDECASEVSLEQCLLLDGPGLPSGGFRSEETLPSSEGGASEEVGSVRCASLPVVTGRRKSRSLIPTKSDGGVVVRPTHWLSKAELGQEIQRLGTLCEARTKELNRLKMETKHVSVGFDAFAALFKYMVEDLNGLSVPVLSADLQKTLKQLELAKQDLAYYEREVEELKSHHCQELNDLSNKLFEVFQGEVTELSTKHEEEMGRLKLDHQKQIETLTLSLNASSEEALSHHEKAVAELQQELINQREELQLFHGRELEELEAKHSQSTKTLQEHIEQMQKQCAELKQHSLSMEDAMKKDTNSKLQWVTSRKLDLEKEVESLKAVLEMKNKELHTIRVQNLEMEKQLEELPLAREKIKMLQARAEDLEALMAEKTKVERKLSTENHQIRETYEKESKVNRRLSMENEELQWRLRQAEQSFVTGSFTEVPEDPEEESNSPTSPAKSPSKSPGPNPMSRSIFFTYVDDTCPSPKSSSAYKKITPGFSANYKTNSPARSSSAGRSKSHSEPPPPSSTPRKGKKSTPKRTRAGTGDVTEQQLKDAFSMSVAGSMASSLSSECSSVYSEQRLLEEHGEQILHSLEILREQRNSEELGSNEGDGVYTINVEQGSKEHRLAGDQNGLHSSDIMRNVEEGSSRKKELMDEHGVAQSLEIQREQSEQRSVEEQFSLEIPSRKEERSSKKQLSLELTGQDPDFLNFDSPEEHKEQILISLEMFQEQKSSLGSRELRAIREQSEQFLRSLEILQGKYNEEERLFLEQHKEQIRHSLQVLQKGEDEMSRSSEFSDPKTYYHMTFPGTDQSHSKSEGRS